MWVNCLFCAFSTFGFWLWGVGGDTEGRIYWMKYFTHIILDTVLYLTIHQNCSLTCGTVLYLTAHQYCSHTFRWHPPTPFKEKGDRKKSGPVLFTYFQVTPLNPPPLLKKKETGKDLDQYCSPTFRWPPHPPTPFKEKEKGKNLELKTKQTKIDTELYCWSSCCWLFGSSWENILSAYRLGCGGGNCRKL